MNQLLTKCPVCSNALHVTRLRRDSCGTTIEGQFSPGGFGGLSQEQMEFVKLFVKNEGKLNRMEGELNLSYPTLRLRLQEILQILLQSCFIGCLCHLCLKFSKKFFLLQISSFLQLTMCYIKFFNICRKFILS